MRGFFKTRIENSMNKKIISTETSQPGELPLETFFQTYPACCFILSLSGTIEKANEQAINILGYSRPEVIGTPLKELFPPQNSSSADRMINKLISTGFLNNESTVLMTKSGDELPFLCTIIPTKIEKNKFNKSICIFQDNLEFQKASLNLKRAQAMAHLGHWDFDNKNKTFIWSDEAYRIFGKTPENFTPTFKAFLECIHPDDRRQVRLRFEGSLTEELSSFNIKHRIIHGITGKPCWVYQKYFHNRNRNGELHSTSGIVQNIDFTENLLIENEKFYHAVKYSHTPIIITDRNGLITFINKRCEDLYNYSSNELIGENPKVLNPGRRVYYDNGYDKMEYDGLFESMWQDLRDPTKGFWDGELLNKTKDDELVSVHMFIRALRDGKGAVYSYIGTHVDITEERRNENIIRIETYKAIASLAEHRDNETGQHMRRIGEFCCFIAGELGQPKKFTSDIRIFAPLHDIGKVGISDAILHATRKLTNEEFEIMKTHTLIGYDILKGRPTLEMAAEIAAGHHERWDGSGYPAKLKGTDIPLSARICTIADVYDSLRSERPYKKAFSEEKTLKLIKKSAGTHLDPMLVNLLMENKHIFDEIFKSLTD